MSLWYTQQDNRSIVIGTVLSFPDGDDTRILPRTNQAGVSEFVVDLNHLDDAFQRDDRDSDWLPTEIWVKLQRDASVVDVLRHGRQRSRAIVYASILDLDLRHLWQPGGGPFEKVKNMRFYNGALPDLRGDFANSVPLERLRVLARWNNNDRWRTPLPTTLQVLQIALSQVDDADEEAVSDAVAQRARDYPNDPFTEWRTGLFPQTMLVDVNEALPYVMVLPNITRLELFLRRLRGSKIRLRPVDYPLHDRTSVFLPRVAENLTELTLMTETLDAPIDLFAPLVNLRRYTGALPHPMGNYMSCQTTLERLSITHSTSIYDVPVHITQFSALRRFCRSWPDANDRRYINQPSALRVFPPDWAIELAWPVQVRNMALRAPELPEPPYAALPHQPQPTLTTAPTIYTLDRTTSKAIATLRHVGVTNIDAIVGILASAFSLHGQTQFISRAIAHQFANTP